MPAIAILVIIIMPAYSVALNPSLLSRAKKNQLPCTIKHGKFPKRVQKRQTRRAKENTNPRDTPVTCSSFL